jgi:predicted alpha/beta-fold hydrolase
MLFADPPPLTLRIVKIKGYDSQDDIRDTLRYALYQVRDYGLSFWAREYPINGAFFDKAYINETQIQPNHPPLHYKLWMQPNKTSLVIIIPGLGGHYQGTGVNAMAQTYYKAGHSVLIVSSAMNWEFYLAACTSNVPGYTPLDAKDIRNALRKIVADVKKEYPNRITTLHLVGNSLGALHALFVAKLESESKNKIGFKSYLAIHPPVNMLNALTTLDEFFDKWKSLPRKKVAQKIEKAVATYLTMIKQGLPKNKRININRETAEILIALSYRYALCELLLAVKKKGNDMGVIKTKYGFTNNILYKELATFSFQKYADELLKKSIQKKTNKALSMKELAKKGGLHSISSFLTKAKNINVINSLNDFLLDQNDLKWFAKTFGDRILFFKYGGHLGELYTKEAKQTIVECLKLGNKQRWRQ